jgi:hypothetical protein
MATGRVPLDGSEAGVGMSTVLVEATESEAQLESDVAVAGADSAMRAVCWAGVIWGCCELRVQRTVVGGYGGSGRSRL